MTPATRSGGIVQVHLTRRCNLQCVHCYSESGPRQTQALAFEALVGFLSWARGEGFTHLSLSGGEPLLYPELIPLLRAAKQDGWSLSAVTNGTLNRRPGSRQALQLLDLVGVSIDGQETQHNRMRGGGDAFRRTLGNLEALRELGVPFVFVHTLTRNSLSDLQWLLDLALDQGASGLRLHPLEFLGHGKQLHAIGLSPEEVSLAYLWVRSRQAELGERRFQLEIDLVNRFQLGCEAGTSDNALARTVSPLVVEPDGVVVPFTFGMDRRFALGSIDTTTSFDPSRIRSQVQGLREAAIRTTLDQPWPFFNWYSRLRDVAAGGGSLGVRT